MDKTMTRFLAIFAALTCAASAQTYRTVTADTNNVIRTNFTLGAAQISGAFAISNVTGLQSALDGKLATNGDAFALTNFPALLLRTNGSAAGLTNFPALLLTTNSEASAFPAALLRTNGDGSGLTNLPNANLTNATGILPLSNGGTGATNASLAISNLLPSYTGNSNRILALDSNATTLIWTTNTGGGGGTTVDLASTNATGILPITKGGTGGTNRESAFNGLGFGSTNNNSISLMNNGGTNAEDRHTVIGSGASAYATNVNVWEAVAIGAVAEVTNGGVAIGRQAVTQNGVSIGQQAKSIGQSVAIGLFADAQGGTVASSTPWTNIGSVAVGSFAVAEETEGTAVGSQALSEAVGSVAIGYNARSGETNSLGEAGTSIGYDTQSDGGIAIGYGAIAGNGIAIGNNTSSDDTLIAIGHNSAVDAFITNSIQIGTGNNNVNNSVQFWNAGSVTTNQWSALANSTVFGGYILAAPTNGAATQVLALNSNATAVVWSAVSNTVTDASTLTNFPTSILQTNSADGSFPSFLLRTNGSASNVTGIVAITNGGTGTNTASGARVNLLPSYTGNSNKVLAVNSNATEIEWITQSGGGGTVDLSTTNATGVLPIAKGGTGGTNELAAHTNLFVISSGSVRILGSANDSTSTAIGVNSVAGETPIASTRSIAIGYNAKTYRPYTIQIGDGTIGDFSFNATNVQFYNWGLVNNNEWAALANAGTVGTNLLRINTARGAARVIAETTNTNYPFSGNVSVVGTNNTNTMVFSNGLLLEVTSP
jgi:hypothetical protein